MKIEYIMNTHFFTLNKYYFWNIVFLLTIIIGTLNSCKKNAQSDDNSLKVFVIDNNGKQVGGKVSVSWDNNKVTYPIEGSAIDKISDISNGITVTLTATPDEGYIFKSWGNGLVGTELTTTFTMNGSKVVSAKFVKVYQLALDPVTGGEIKAYKDTVGKLVPFTDETQIPEGSTVYLIATPNTGNDLLTWTDTITTEDPKSTVNTQTALKTSFVMNSNNKVSAQFATAHKVTYIVPTFSGVKVDSFQPSRYSGKIFAFRDPTFKDSIKDGSLVAEGLRIYAKAIFPNKDNSFDAVWNVSGTSIHYNAKDTVSFLMPTSDFNFSADFAQQGYAVNITTIGGNNPSPTYKYKYGKMENFTDVHTASTGTFSFPRGYTVTLQAITTDAYIWEWSTNVSSLINNEKEQQVQLFINNIDQNVSVTLTPKS